jgi:hypothetical protein
MSAGPYFLASAKTDNEDFIKWCNIMKTANRSRKNIVSYLSSYIFVVGIATTIVMKAHVLHWMLLHNDSMYKLLVYWSNFISNLRLVFTPLSLLEGIEKNSKRKWKSGCRQGHTSLQVQRQTMKILSNDVTSWRLLIDLEKIQFLIYQIIFCGWYSKNNINASSCTALDAVAQWR